MDVYREGFSRLKADILDHRFGRKNLDQTFTDRFDPLPLCATLAPSLEEFPF
jgi:hypothetical protein